MFMGERGNGGGGRAVKTGLRVLAETGGNAWLKN